MRVTVVIVRKDQREMLFTYGVDPSRTKYCALYTALLNGRHEFAQALAKASEKVITS